MTEKPNDDFIKCMEEERNDDYNALEIHEILLQERDKKVRKQALAEVREKIDENLVARLTKLNHEIFQHKDIDGMYGCCVCEECCLNRAKAIELASFRKDFNKVFKEVD